MKELKFRAKDKDGGWMYWTFPKNDGGVEELARDFFFTLADYSTLGEYTGLKDKNGKDIYEGDIVTDGKGKAVVYYRPPGFICVIENQDSFWLGAGLSYPENHQLKETEIIGDIYSNPELLKGGS